MQTTCVAEDADRRKYFILWREEKAFKEGPTMIIHSEYLNNDFIAREEYCLQKKTK